MAPHRIDIVSAVPELLRSPLEHSILGRAQQKGLANFQVHDLRDYTHDLKHRRIDDYPFGGGPGMVLQAEPIARCIEHLEENLPYDERIYLSPDGEVFTQDIANELAQKPNLLLLAGHYKGVDQRVRDRYITREISIGDYVLTGGELPALVLADAIVRLLPGVLGDSTSALSDSFMDGLLDAPHYTRPAVWRGESVPEVLLSGHDARIASWRYEQALAKTQLRRPDLLPPADDSQTA